MGCLNLVFQLVWSQAVLVLNGAGAQKYYSSKLLLCTWFSIQSQYLFQKHVAFFVFSFSFSAQLLVMLCPTRKAEQGNALLPLAIMRIMKMV